MFGSPWTGRDPAEKKKVKNDPGRVKVWENDGFKLMILRETGLMRARAKKLCGAHILQDTGRRILSSLNHN